MAGGDNMRIQPGQTHQMGVNRTQDDAMVGYVFQRPTEPEFSTQSSTFQAKQAPRAWALADDVIVDNVCMIKYAFSLINSLSFNNNYDLCTCYVYQIHICNTYYLLHFFF